MERIFLYFSGISALYLLWSLLYSEQTIFRVLTECSVLRKFRLVRAQLEKSQKQHAVKIRHPNRRYSYLFSLDTNQTKHYLKWVCWLVCLKLLSSITSLQVIYEFGSRGCKNQQMDFWLRIELTLRDRSFKQSWCYIRIKTQCDR